jgi:hypothetical protein
MQQRYVPRLLEVRVQRLLAPLQEQHLTPFRRALCGSWLPKCLLLENKFNGLADRTMACASFRYVVRRLFDLRNRVSHGHSQTSAAHDKKIWKIVLNIRNIRISHSRLSENLLICGYFQRLFHINEFHIHLPCTPKESRALASSDATRAKPAMWAGVRPCPSCASKV